MKKILLASMALSAMFTSAVFAKAKFDEKHLFIKMKANQDVPSNNLIKKVKHLFGNNYYITTTSAVELEAILKEDPTIARVEKNYYSEKELLPKLELAQNQPVFFKSSFNDPQVNKVWAFLDANRNGVSVEKSYQVPLGTEKEEIIVAVVDTGVDYNHEDLKNIMWKNQNEIPGNGIDDDHNGYVDDVFGIDTLKKDSDGNASGDPMASHAHGTHVAGTIAAEQNNNKGIPGIASTVKIMAIRAVPDSSDETDADVVESFLYAAKHGARLINCSFGKAHNEGGMIVNETIDYIGKTYGALVFAAAGNDYGRNIDSRPKYPAAFPSDYLVTIASTTKSGGLSWFSNIGPKSVDFAAPGSNVYSTTPGNRYGNMSGTSMAAPTAVGIAAELLSNFPALEPVELKTVLIKSVTKVSKFRGKMVAEGRVDLFNSLQYTLENYNNL